MSLTTAKNRLCSKNLYRALAVLLLPFMGSQFLKAQVNLNLAAGDAEGAANAALSGANIAWLVVGAVLWLLTAFGLYAVTFAPELLG